MLVWENIGAWKITKHQTGENSKRSFFILATSRSWKRLLGYDWSHLLFLRSTLEGSSVIRPNFHQYESNWSSWVQMKNMKAFLMTYSYFTRTIFIEFFRVFHFMGFVTKLLPFESQQEGKSDHSCRKSTMK